LIEVSTSTTVIPGYIFYPFAAALDSSNGSIVVASYEATPQGEAAPVMLRVWEETASFEVMGRLPPLVHLKLKFVLAPEQQIQRALTTYYPL